MEGEVKQDMQKGKDETIAKISWKEMMNDEEDEKYMQLEIRGRKKGREVTSKAEQR